MVVSRDISKNRVHSVASSHMYSSPRPVRSPCQEEKRYVGKRLVFFSWVKDKFIKHSKGTNEQEKRKLQENKQNKNTLD